MEIIQVDAFTDRPFAGNPAAVCVLPAMPDAGWMQQVAREMNLSETAFLVRRDDGAFDLRWFTPAAEVDLCGHATLGSAHVLWEEGHLPPDATARFFTRSGLLEAHRKGDWIEMDFPAEAPQACEAPAGLLEAIGAEPTFVGRNRMDHFVVLASEDAVRALRPNMAGIEALGKRGVIVTAPATTDGYDFVSRYFAPAFGIPEDPVTGSAHCSLGPYWQQQLGKDDLMGYQASARGGIVRVQPQGARVLLSGQAVTVLRAVLVAELVAG